MLTRENEPKWWSTSETHSYPQRGTNFSISSQCCSHAKCFFNSIDILSEEIGTDSTSAENDLYCFITLLRLPPTTDYRYPIRTEKIDIYLFDRVKNCIVLVRLQLSSFPLVKYSIALFSLVHPRCFESENNLRRTLSCGIKSVNYVKFHDSEEKKRKKDIFFLPAFSYTNNEANEEFPRCRLTFVRGRGRECEKRVGCFLSKWEWERETPL